MDNFLIDFSSPKQLKEDSPLIPKFFNGVTNGFKGTISYSEGQGESNPFDFVVCQVAANAAAENDPFEMVMNDALNCPESRTEKTEQDLDLFNSPQPLNKNCRKSMSLPDLRRPPEPEVTFESTTNTCDNINGVVSSPLHMKASNEISVSGSSGNEASSTSGNGWSLLDDIQPPESLLNSTVDMSCFLDDTLSTSIINLDPCKDGSDLLDETSNCSHLVLHNQDESHKSEDELRILAQKKIENIISKAEMEVQSDIQDSFMQRRLSIQEWCKPSQEVIAMCTPSKKSSKTEQMPWSLDKWSENELKKLDLILPDMAPKPQNSKNRLSDAAALHIKNLELKMAAMATLNDMPEKALSPHSPSLQNVTPVKGKSMTNDTSSSQAKRKSSSVSPLPSSPTLLPLPLCEDAVRNLSLCSKYSPNQNSSLSKDKTGEPQKSALNKEQSSKHAKLTLRKPVMPSRPLSKMAPMKATAPVQNMTRTRSSLATALKPEAKNSVACVNRKLVLKVPDGKPSTKENSRCLRMPQSPSRALSGSMPNLSSQGIRPTTRLPSPRRSAGPTAGSLHAPTNLKERFEGAKERSSGFSSSPHPSPRPVRRSSPCKTGSHPRVLAEINTHSSARMSPKCRPSYSEAPRRGGSVLTEKENYL